MGHPPGCIKGAVYSRIIRYFDQNIYRKDYIYFVRKLYCNLLNIGWGREYICVLILEATSVIEARGTQQLQPATSRYGEDNLFMHLEFHPYDVSHGRIRELYKEHCGELLKKEIDIERPIIAYSRQNMRGVYVTQAKLHQAYGKIALIIMGEFKQGLSP